MSTKIARNKLAELYAGFEAKAGPYVGQAVCKPGCADCCTNVGDIDATTLEGLFVLGYIQGLPASLQKALSKKLKSLPIGRGGSKYQRCPFLQDDRLCAIYPVRPFSCRRLYSVRQCGAEGPVVHRQVWAMAEETLSAILALDDNGYCGYLPSILELLKISGFRKLYLSGGFSPDDIRSFARQHKLAINRFAGRPSEATQNKEKQHV